MIKEAKKKMIELDEFIYFDDNEMIERFKELISPDNEKYYKNRTLNTEFQLIRRYLVRGIE